MNFEEPFVTAVFNLTENYDKIEGLMTLSVNCDAVKVGMANVNFAYDVFFVMCVVLI